MYSIKKRIEFNEICLGLWVEIIFVFFLLTKSFFCSFAGAGFSGSLSTGSTAILCSLPVPFYSTTTLGRLVS